MFHIFTFNYSFFKGFITNSQYAKLPVGLIAQLDEHCTGMVAVMRSNTILAWSKCEQTKRKFPVLHRCYCFQLIMQTWDLCCVCHQLLCFKIFNFGIVSKCDEKVYAICRSRYVAKLRQTSIFTPGAIVNKLNEHLQFCIVVYVFNR